MLQNDMALKVSISPIFSPPLLFIPNIFSHSQRKILENRSLTDEERMDALENQLKEARFLAEEADKKYDEVMRLCLITSCVNTVPITFVCASVYFRITLVCDLLCDLW